MISLIEPDGTSSVPFRCNFSRDILSQLHHDAFTVPPAIVYSFAGGERRKWRRAQQLTKKRLFARTFSAAAGSAFRSLPFRHVREFPFRIGADRAKKRRKCRVQCINNSRSLLSSQSDATCSARSPCHFQKPWQRPPTVSQILTIPACRDVC